MTSLLLWVIYAQVKGQLSQVSISTVLREGALTYFFIALLLLPLNLAIEIYKWKLLVASAQPISFGVAVRSFLAGLSLSLLTPNRIGEYPGRILFLQQKNTPRLISVTLLGMYSQLLSLLIFGIVGLMFYYSIYPGYWQKVVLIIALMVSLLAVIVFLNFEKWSRYIERISFLKKFKTYSRMLKRFSTRQQLVILGLSLLRFVVYASQYLLLMRWMHIEMEWIAGFGMACMFFFSMAIVPSIALAEMGIRGQLSLLFFQHFTTNKIGILVATIALWVINLILPAIAGSILWIKLRWIK